MTDEEKIIDIEQRYAGGKEFQMVERLESYRNFTGPGEFRNYLLILLVMLQRSKAAESAATLLWKKVFNEHIGRTDTSLAYYGETIIGLLKELAVFPYTNLAASVGRLIATLIYDRNGIETKHITETVSRSQLLELNEFLLHKHSTLSDFNNDRLNLSYNCIRAIETESLKIYLSNKAIEHVRENLKNGQFVNYLHYFIRPYYSYISSNSTPETRYHVPEPFYLQFFDNYDIFIELLRHQATLGPRTVWGEVLDFMIKFKVNQEKGFPYVDIGPLRLTREFHRLVRFD